MGVAKTKRASFADVLRNTNFRADALGIRTLFAAAGIITALSVLPALTMMKGPDTGAAGSLETIALPSAAQLVEV